MPAPVTEWTAEMAIALAADGNRYEVLDGELFVTPAPSVDHQLVVGGLFTRLVEYVRSHELGLLLFSPAEITFSAKRLVQPDLFVIPTAGRPRPTDWRDIRTLSLAIEVLSPTTARADRHRKRLIYQDEGVPEYWIVDADARLFERWRPGDTRPEIVADTFAWHTLSHADAFCLDLPQFFDEALGWPPTAD